MNIIYEYFIKYIFVMSLHTSNSVYKVVPVALRNMLMYLVHDILNSILFSMIIYLVNNQYWMHKINTYIFL